MKTSHTPGPWQAAYAGSGDWYVYDAQCDQIIASLNFWDADAFPEDVTCANAGLIEASPKLLDLLARALPFVEDAETDPAYEPGHVRKLVKEIRDAIESL